MLAIGSAAFYLGVSPVTLRRYEKKGLIRPLRTPGNHRRYSTADLDSLLATTQETPLPHEKEGQQEKSVAVYARVSQPIQKANGDLDRQVELVKDEASKRDLYVSGVYTDVASGLNDKRRGLWKMCHDARRGLFSKVLVTFPDRLSRFCVSYLEKYLEIFGVSVEYVQSSAEITPNEELVQDLLAIIACFGGKLHGMRAKKNWERERAKMAELQPKFLEWMAGHGITFVSIDHVDQFLAERNQSLMKRMKKRMVRQINQTVTVSA